MSIFTQIKTLKLEDMTTEILVYLLKSDSLRKTFLNLTGMSGEAVSFNDISTQVQDSDAQARPDICIETKNAILYVENKPWISSIFTKGEGDQPDQIKRYADKLVKEHGHKENRILTLLTLQLTREHQLRTIAEVEHLPTVPEDINQLEEALKNYYKDKGIAFFTLTWRKLFDSFRNQCNDKENDAYPYKAIFDSLNEDIPDSEYFEKIENNIKDFHSHYEILEKIAFLADEDLKELPRPFIQPDRILVPTPKGNNPKTYNAKNASFRYYLKYEVLPLWGMFQWGISTFAYPVLRDKKHKELSHPFIFCIQLDKPSDKNDILRQAARVPLFRFGDPNAENFLEEKGFTRIEEKNIHYFVKPLNLDVCHFLQINQDMVTHAVIESANEYVKICKEFIRILQRQQ